jgi:dethiobiotin synthetase
MALEFEQTNGGSQLMIVGTDTGVGKTVLTSALVAYWLSYPRPHQSLGLLKPLQTGTGDREHYLKLFPELNQTLEELTPQWFPEPLAPPIAAERAGDRVALERLWQGFLHLQRQRQFVLVEGLGGLGSPVTHESTVADLAWDWQLPVVLVVPVRLGAIGQAVANIALAKQSRLYVKGIVLSCVQPCGPEEIEDWAAPDLMRSLTGIPIIGVLPHLTDPTDRSQLVAAASQLDLERFFDLAPVLA